MFVSLFFIIKVVYYKLRHGEVMTDNTRSYNDEDFDYIDRCDVDLMSIFELGNMLIEFGVSGFKYTTTSFLRLIGLEICGYG